MPGTNEFVFELGLLEIPLRAEVIGEHGLRSETLDWLEPRLSWSFDPVGDSHDSSPSVPSEQVQTQWCAPNTSGPCEGGVGSVGSVTRSASTYGVQLKLVGLPRRYDDFGPKGFELGFDPFLDDPSFVPYPVGEAVAEVFFDPSGVDHPVSDSITMTQDELRVPPGGRPVGEGFPVLVYETSGALEPNWAYYYSQIAQDLAEETLVLRYVSDAEETPVPFTAATPKMSDWLYFQGNPSTVWMARGMFGLVVNSLGEETLGINAFANIIAHESRHIDDVYLMSDPANCGPYWARSLEPEGLQSGWGVSANAFVVSKDDWAFNRYEERVIEGVFNEGLDVLLDDDGDGMCNNGDELPKEFNELEIRADDSMLFPACTEDLWEEPECDLARLDWGADGFNYAGRGIFGF